MTERSDLMKWFDFDEADLEANRSGRLSVRQRARLTAPPARQPWRTLSAMMPAGIVLVIAPAVGTIFFWVRYADRPETGTLALAVLTTVVLVAGGLLTLVGLRSFNHAKQTLDALLQADLASGAVRGAPLRLMYDEGGEHLYAADEREDIWLYHDSLRRLAEHSRYRVYFLPQSQTLLALEPEAE